MMDCFEMMMSYSEQIVNSSVNTEESLNLCCCFVLMLFT